MMKNDIDPLVELAQRFPYQFAGQHLGINVAKGWAGLFTKLCEDVDATLGDDKKGFHWRQVKEKFGAGRFYWHLGSEPPSLRFDLIAPTGVVSLQGKPSRAAGGTTADLMDKLRALESAAEERSHKICIVCGTDPAKIDSHGGYMLNLCAHHSEQRRGGNLESPWYQE